jgi:hypothetical protein
VQSLRFQHCSNRNFFYDRPDKNSSNVSFHHTHCRRPSNASKNPTQKHKNLGNSIAAMWPFKNNPHHLFQQVHHPLYAYAYIIFQNAWRNAGLFIHRGVVAPKDVWHPI